jgi:hypothetical protein
MLPKKPEMAGVRVGVMFLLWIDDHNFDKPALFQSMNNVD